MFLGKCKKKKIVFNKIPKIIFNNNCLKIYLINKNWPKKIIWKNGGLNFQNG